MKAVTVRHSPAAPKNFSWSFSRLNNYETCPRRYHEIDVLKNYKESSENLDWGSAVHAAAAARLVKDVPMPKGMEYVEPFAKRILKGASKGKLFVEQELACTRDMIPCDWRDWNNCWIRTKVDVMTLAAPVALIGDWKTGKIKEDSQQLALTGAMVFAHYPEVKHVRSEFWWLKENATTRIDMTRANLTQFWASMLPRIEQMEQAASTDSYPPRQGYLCKRYCPVTECIHNGI